MLQNNKKTPIPAELHNYGNMGTRFPEKVIPLFPLSSNPKDIKNNATTYKIYYVSQEYDILNHKGNQKGNHTIADLRYGVKYSTSPSTLIFAPIKG